MQNKKVVYDVIVYQWVTQDVDRHRLFFAQFVKE